MTDKYIDLARVENSVKLKAVVVDVTTVITLI